MAYTLESLAQSLQSSQYTPLSEEEILRQAKTQYQSAYENQVLSANQAHALSELGYTQQLEQLTKSYTRQTEQAKGQTALSLSETDRQALSRGMQRSSYNAATLSNVRLAGDKTLADIASAQTQDEKDIAEQRTLSAKQLGEILKQASREYDTNVLAYADTLRDREYQRAAESARYQNELAMAMYEYTNQLQEQQRAQARWQAEFNESVRQYEQSRMDQQMAMQGTQVSSGGGSYGTYGGSQAYVADSAGASRSVSSVAGTTNTTQRKVNGKVSDYI